jgi:hypothetical protein
VGCAHFLDCADAQRRGGCTREETAQTRSVIATPPDDGTGSANRFDGETTETATHALTRRFRARSTGPQSHSVCSGGQFVRRRRSCCGPPDFDEVIGPFQSEAPREVPLCVPIAAMLVDCQRTDATPQRTVLTAPPVEPLPCVRTDAETGLAQRQPMSLGVASVRLIRAFGPPIHFKTKKSAAQRTLCFFTVVFCTAQRTHRRGEPLQCA